MSRPSAPQFTFVRREEKEFRIRELVVRHLQRQAADSFQGVGEKTCLMIARSADSPMAKTVLSLGASGALRGYSVRAIFGFLGTAETVKIAEACRASAWSLQVRWARDLRLLEAHEQLVLGTETSWYGDSMRRDPSIRDACELYAPECPVTARRSIQFFENLWRASEPVFERTLVPTNELPDPALIPSITELSSWFSAKCRVRTSA